MDGGQLGDDRRRRHPDNVAYVGFHRVEGIACIDRSSARHAASPASGDEAASTGSDNTIASNAVSEINAASSAAAAPEAMSDQRRPSELRGGGRTSCASSAIVCGPAIGVSVG